MTEEVELEVRKWGNSLGVRIPIEVARREGLKPNDRVVLQLSKLRRPRRDVFGALKGAGIDAQALKDRLRVEHA
ncbi:MAG: AbrB/MazE/SpoVT family DNA-binding domain-containing protein [Thermoplasmata archaeon]